MVSFFAAKLAATAGKTIKGGMPSMKKIKKPFCIQIALYCRECDEYSKPSPNAKRIFRRRHMLLHGCSHTVKKYKKMKAGRKGLSGWFILFIIAVLILLGYVTVNWSGIIARILSLI